MSARPHPLHNITPAEIRHASETVSHILKEQHHDDRPLWFKHVYLQEPPKALLMPYLDAENAGVPAPQRPFVPRLAGVIYHPVGQAKEFREIIVSLDSGTEVEFRTPTTGMHSSFDR